MKHFFILLIIFFLCSCGNKPTEKSQSGDLPVKKEKILPEQLVQTWNNAHNQKDTAVFSSLFGDTVLFYQTSIDRNAVLKKKAKLFKKYPDFVQEITNLKTDTGNRNQLTCSFVKKVTIKNETKEYPSYLVFKDSGNGWLIIAESDEITDKNIAAKKNRESSAGNGKTEGDYNGDGKKEYAWLEAPEFPEATDDNFGDCVGNCEIG